MSAHRGGVSCEEKRDAVVVDQRAKVGGSASAARREGEQVFVEPRAVVV